jgi:hypothetical protein
MRKVNKDKLATAYLKACNAYIKAFCRKHGYDESYVVWDSMSDAYTYGIAMNGYWIDLSTIITDIEDDAPVAAVGEWSHYCMRVYFIDTKIDTPNFRSWVLGCPRYTEEELTEMEQNKSGKECPK